MAADLRGGARKTITAQRWRKAAVPLQALHKNVIECGYGDSITLIIADSVTASGLFSDASVDWIHLDARHDYASVKTDVQAWLPKLKRGGWLSGDDYDEIKWPEVVNAVRDLLPGATAWSTQQWRWIVP
ncbi:MAG TPA: class I SAM-dependent methyltransferase [Blastocatellia bacterium]